MDKKLLEKALKLWSNDFQLDMLAEECLECAKAVFDYKRRKKDSFTNLMEEMADVEILLEQIKTMLCFGGDKFAFRTAKVKKIKRLRKMLRV